MNTGGITIDRNMAGAPTFAHIDLRKYGKDLSAFFKKIGFSIENKSVAETSTDKLTAKQFLTKWSGKFSNMSDKKTDAAKLEYLTNKHS